MKTPARREAHPPCFHFARIAPAQTPFAALEKNYGQLFFRCHQSYLINPHYVRSVRRFRLTLTDGTQLPIPEKKYTAFRDSVQQAMRH